MTSAAMIATVMSFPMMLMVIAVNIWIIPQISGEKSINGVISISAHAAEKTDASLSKSVLCTAANAAADQFGNFGCSTESADTE